MKKSQLILAAALVALAACSKENINFKADAFEEEIGFNVVNKKATRANGEIISGTTYATDNTFKVWGWQSPAADFSEFSTDDASNVMSGLTISYCGGPESRADAWRNADHYYYWPFTGKISFLAVHPSEVAPTTTGWDATNKKPQATIADYTIAAGNKTVDLMLASNEGARRTDPLPLVFKHALSQIQFRVRTNDDYSADATFKVNSITINKIDLSGDLAYANDAFNWSDNAAQTENWPYYATTATVAYAATDAAAALYGDANVMIPQAAFADDPATTEIVEGTTLTINYTLEQNGSAPFTGDITVAAGQEWLAGKKYIYTLNFKLQEILFAPEATDWVDVEVATINITD